MPTTLDPVTALVLIDLQRGITALPTVHPSEEIVARCARLVEAFRANDLLVAATRAAFARDGGDVIKTRTAESPTDGKPVPDYGGLCTEVGLSDGPLPGATVRVTGCPAARGSPPPGVPGRHSR
jgi:Isochorismatase family